MKKHPVNDYQPGSVRDDFDFGPLLIFNRTEFHPRQPPNDRGKKVCRPL